VKLTVPPWRLARMPKASPQEDVDEAVRWALRKISSWRTPVNWSERDWCGEVKAITAAAGWLADVDYDPRRGVPRSAFVYQRALTSAWTRYRQEWAYCKYLASQANTNGQRLAAPAETRMHGPGLNRTLGRAIDQLSLPEQWLIRQLFWNGATQHQLATVLRISQQAVSRRKRRALKHLRRLLHEVRRSHLSSNLFAAAAFLSQALDLGPAPDWGL